MDRFDIHGRPTRTSVIDTLAQIEPAWKERDRSRIKCRKAARQAGHELFGYNWANPQERGRTTQRTGLQATEPAEF